MEKWWKIKKMLVILIAFIFAIKWNYQKILFGWNK